MLRLWGAVLLLALMALRGAAGPPVPEAAKASAHFDANVATDAWLATIPNQKANSDAYFEGGYWLILWDFVYTVAMMFLLLETKFSARIRDWTERVVRAAFLRSWLYWLCFRLPSP